MADASAHAWVLYACEDTITRQVLKQVVACENGKHPIKMPLPKIQTFDTFTVFCCILMIDRFTNECLESAFSVQPDYLHFILHVRLNGNGCVYHLIR